MDKVIAQSLDWRKPAAGFFALWTVFALMELAQDWFMVRNAGWRFVPSAHIAQAALIFYPWFFFSLAIGRWCMRTPLTPFTRRAVLLHGSVAVVAGLLHLWIILASMALCFPGRIGSHNLLHMFTGQALKWFHFEILVYFAIALAWSTLLERASAASQGGRLERPSPLRQHLSGKCDGERHTLMVSQIDWIQSDDNYVIAHAGPLQVRARVTLKALQSELDSRQFVRVHRRAIINLKRLQRTDGMQLHMISGAKITCSRNGRQALAEVLHHTGRV